MMCNQNKNSTALIDGSQGFTRCTQIWLATKIGGATAIKNFVLNEPWDLGLLWEPVLYCYSTWGEWSEVETRKDDKNKVEVEYL